MISLLGEKGYINRVMKSERRGFMSFWSKLVKGIKQFLSSMEAERKQKENQEPANHTNDTKNREPIRTPLYIDSKPGISITSGPVGDVTGSTATDFYVYEWFIKDTGEVFYVGKGRGDRYKAFHERAYEAEKIRKMYDTDVRFVGTGLTEEEAVILESREMERILNETNDRLTNRIIPFFTERDNGYGRSLNTPELRFETAPHFYASEIEEHYYGTESRPFDEVTYDNLKTVVFITSHMRDEIDTIYAVSYTHLTLPTKLEWCRSRWSPYH